MSFTLADTGALFLAVVAGGVIVAAPGFAMARLFGFGRDARGLDALTGVVVGLATLPLVDSLSARFLGLDSALVVTLVLALAGAVMAVRGGAARPSAVGLALVFGWLALLTLEWVDFDIAGRLHAPLTIFDTVKHAATTQAIYDSGAPPRDAFFLRPERSSYYYFFYTLAALVMRLCGGLVDAKAAVGGVAFWTGIGVYGLVRLALARTGLDAALAPRRRPVLIVLVLGAGGLDIVAILYFAWARHYWIAAPLQWNEQIAAWLENLLWVPHHVTALVAGMVGLVALCDAVGDVGAPAAPRGVSALRVGLAGICFAAALGLSIWVTLGFVLTIVAWTSVLLAERRWRALALIGVAGALALVVAIPQLLDLKAGRAGGGEFPIGVTVRIFMPIELVVSDAWRLQVRLLALPLNYAIEFGALALGSFLFWRQRRAGLFPGGEFGRVLAIAALAGLFAGGFLRSTLFYNDLGWRVLLLPLLAATVWTVAVLDRLLSAPAAPRPLGRHALPALAGLMAVGWTTMLYGAVMMRAYPFVEVNPAARFIAADPETQHGLRLAYAWANGHLPRSAVLQQDPGKRRAFAFGVYGTNPTGVADALGSLYGADPRAVTARVAALAPIFETKLPLSDVAARAAAAGVNDLVVTAADPVWAQPDSFVWRVAPVYASARVRIIPVVTLQAAR